MSWAAIAATVVGAGLSAGMAVASQPDLVSPTKSSRKAVLASLRALPAQRQLESAARLGQKVEYDADNWMRPREAYKAGLITEKEWKYYQRLNEKQGAGIFGDLMPGTEPLTTGPNEGQNQDQRTGTHGGRGVRVKGGHMQINIGKRTADFTGYGDADIQGKLAKDLAGVQLELQKKYGTDFVNLAREQQEQADPQGTAARKLLASEINRMEDERATRERPVAEMLDAQMLADLKTGGGIDPEQQAAMDRVLARRGDVTGDVAGDLESGAAGESRLKRRLQKGMSYLGSGATPEDADFRDEQQGLANMSSFLAGRTPQSQFASLSSAQQGASPGVRAPSLPGVDPNLVNNAQQAGTQSYQAGVRSAATQVNPWFVGLSALTKGVQAYNAGRPA